MIWSIMIWPEIIWLVNFTLYNLYSIILDGYTKETACAGHLDEEKLKRIISKLGHMSPSAVELYSMVYLT